MEVVADAGALCESGVSRTGRDCPVQRKAKGRIGMIYRTHNLTGGVVVCLNSRAGHPEADALIEEMTLILALQDEMKR